MTALVPKKIASNQKRLYDWIRKNAYSKRPEGEFIAIRIHQVHNKTKVGDEVERLDVPKKEDRHESWDADLTAEILNVLQMEAGQFGGLQHYACYSVFSGSDETVNRCVVAIHTEEEKEDDDELLSEPPNGRGLVAQAMRHQEANARTVTGAVMQVFSTLQRQNDKLMDMNETLMRTQMNMAKDMTEMWEERRNLILNTQVEHLKAHGIEEGISFFKKIAPIVVNQWVGKDLLPVDKKAGVTSMARSFYGSLTEEQLSKLGQVLRQDQMIHFMTMGETLVSDEEDENKEKKG